MARKLFLAATTFIVVLSFVLLGTDAYLRGQTMNVLKAVEPPAPYRIERDDYGVPSIYGLTDEAVAFGLAYAHAEDDFATIQMRIAPVKNQMGAITGREGVVIDYINRFVGSREAVALGKGKISPEALAMARGYAAGLNAYAAQHPDEMLRHQLFPVDEDDVLAGFALVSPFFYGLDDVLTKLNDGELPEDAPLTDRRGSNAIAVAPHRMADGSTVLISNSHQPWEGVAAWWEARIASGEGWSMAGPLFPGVPFILMGYNEYLSWTNTVNVPDLVDVYALELDEGGKNYRFDGEWRSIDVESFWLRVKVGPLVVPVRQKVERSVHGPIIRNDKGAFAVRYAGMGGIQHFEQYYRLNRATSFEEWTDVMRMGAIPSTNFIYADHEGNIAYLYNAAFPKRDPSIDWSGVLPGTSSEFLWTSYEPFEAQPFYVNPDSGYLLNANNTPFLATADEDNLQAEEFASLVGIETITTNRIARLLALFEAERGRRLSMDDLHRIRSDVGYTFGSPLGELFEAFVSDPSLDAVDADAMALLRTWDKTLDGVGAADSLAALIIYDRYLGMRGYYEERPHADVLKEATDRLRTSFGRLDPTLTDLSRLRRGDVDLPLVGGPDALRAIYWDIDEVDGRLAGTAGDSYIGIISWDADGQLSAETIYPYGAAMGRPDSAHYADQAQMFVDGEYKKAPLPDWRKAAALAGTND
ncbi:MAG: penicillin acylase family protein [Pseudomonadota bacterium]